MAHESTSKYVINNASADLFVPPVLNLSELQKDYPELDVESPIVLAILRNELILKANITLDDEDLICLELLSLNNVNGLLKREVKALHAFLESKIYILEDVTGFAELYATICAEMAQFKRDAQAKAFAKAFKQAMAELKSKDELFCDCGNYQLIRDPRTSAIYAVEKGSVNLEQFSVCHRLDPRTGEFVETLSIKIFSSDMDNRSVAEKEARRLSPYFAEKALIEYYTNELDDGVFLIMENMEGRIHSLEQASFSEKIKVLREIARALHEKRRPSYKGVLPRKEMGADLKNDTHLFIPTVLDVLGYVDPFASKISKKIFNLPEEFKAIILMFLNRMGAKKRGSRPDSGEFLVFFETLCRCVESDTPEDRKLLDCLVQPKAVLREKMLPEYPDSQWQLFLFVSRSENYLTFNAAWELLANAISNNIQTYTEEQQKIFLDTVHAHKPQKTYNSIIEAVVKKKRSDVETELINFAAKVEACRNTEVELTKIVDDYIWKNDRKFERALTEVEKDQLAIVHLAKTVPGIKLDDPLTAAIIAHTLVYTRLLDKEIETCLLLLNPATLVMLSVSQCKRALDFLEKYKENPGSRVLAIEREKQLNVVLAQKRHWLQELEPLKKKKRVFVDIHRDLRLVKCPKTATYYAVYFSKPLGVGRYGHVYVAYPLDPETGELGEKCAVKISQNESPVKKEWERMPTRLKREKPFKIDEREAEQNSGYYLFMAFVPGQDLGTLVADKIQPEKSLNSFPFGSMVNLFWLLASRLHELQHNTTSNAAITHGDIKPTNIKFTPEGAELLDFGFARKLKPDKKFVRSGRYTINYAAPEVRQSHFRGAKSDVFALAKTFEFILCEIKDRSQWNPSEREVVNIIERFMGKMTIERYDRRADSRETLQFFTGLKNYSLATTAEQKSDCLEKLEFLANPDDVVLKEVLPSEKENQWQLFFYIANNIACKKEKLFNLATILAEKIDQESGPHVREFFREINKQKIMDNFDPILKMKVINQLYNGDTEDKFELFLYLSDEKNYEANEEQWKTLAENIAQNINGYTGKQMIVFLRELNKHNADNKHNEVRDVVIQKLSASLKDYKGTLFYFNPTRLAVNKVKRAVKGKNTRFFDSAERLAAVAEGRTSKRELAIVERLTIPRVKAAA